MTDLAVFLGGLVTLAGVLIGSFLNALVWRLHKNMPIGGKERSQCTHCSRQLAWYDLIPLASWIMLKAKCRYCKGKISVQYPIVELLNGVLWLVSFAVIYQANSSLIDTLVLLLWLATSSVLLALAVYDYRWMILPNKLVAWFVGLSSVIALLKIIQTGTFSLATIADPLAGVFVLAGLFWVLFQVSNEQWIGGGDVKLAVGIGLLLGFEMSLVCLFIASLTGSIFGLASIGLFGKSRKDMIPFGPFLIAATFVCYVWSTQINQLFYTLIGF